MSLFVCSSSRERGVWLGLSDVNSAGKLHWVNGSEAQEGEEGLLPRSSVTRGNHCVSLDQRGQTSSHSCNAKRAYVCQYNPQGRHQTLARMRTSTYTRVIGKLQTHFNVSPQALHGFFLQNFIKNCVKQYNKSNRNYRRVLHTAIDLIYCLT